MTICQVLVYESPKLRHYFDAFLKGNVYLVLRGAMKVVFPKHEMQGSNL